jgi:hypothetical protein
VTLNTEYGKIETLYERDPQTFKLWSSLCLKNHTYGLIKEWVWTEKIDGFNVRCNWEPLHTTFDDINGPNETVWSESLRFGGRSDGFKWSKGYQPLLNFLTTNITADKLRDIFPAACVTLYGEGYGAGIQKVGASYATGQYFILFDVFIHDQDNRMGGWWLTYGAMADTARQLGIASVPHIGVMSLEEATEMVYRGFQSTIGIAQAEGLVGRPGETLYDKRGHRIITKIKTKDFDPNLNYFITPKAADYRDALAMVGA